MAEEFNIRWTWLKIMYIYTILGAGLSGLGIIFVPEKMIALNKFAPQDPLIFGVVGSVWAAFGVLSIFGLRDPLKFVPVLLMQLFYKSIWIIGVVMPIFFRGDLSANDVVFVVGMLTYVIGDLIAIPFPYVFSQKKES
jgi:hypothetical protein